MNGGGAGLDLLGLTGVDETDDLRTVLQMLVDNRLAEPLPPSEERPQEGPSWHIERMPSVDQSGSSRGFDSDQIPTAQVVPIARAVNAESHDGSDRFKVAQRVSVQRGTGGATGGAAGSSHSSSHIGSSPNSQQLVARRQRVKRSRMCVVQ